MILTNKRKEGCFMRTHLWKYVLIGLLLLLSLPMAVACEKEAPGSDMESRSETGSETGTEAVTQPSQDPNVTLGALSAYRVICSEDASKDLIVMALELIDQINTKTSIALSLGGDWPEGGEDAFEIVIGQTIDPKTKELKAALSESEYGIYFIGRKIYLVGGCDEVMTDAITAFSEHCVDAKDQALTIPENAVCSGSVSEKVLLARRYEKMKITELEAKNKYITGTTEQDAVSYRVGEEIVFNLELKADSKLAGCELFSWKLTADDGTSSNGMADGRSGKLTIKTSISKPGYVYLQVTACDAGGKAISGVKMYNGGAGANIEEIEKIKDEPADFDAFWADQLKLLDGVSPELIECTEVSGASGYKVYAVKVRTYSGTWGDYVSGYLSIPQSAKPGSLKIRMWYNGHGVENPTIYYNADTALFNVCAHSIEIGRETSYYNNLKSTTLYDYAFKYNSDRETVYFREMILRDIQALRFMKQYFGANGSDPRFAGLWNGETIRIIGGSQGGFQAVAVAALEGGITEVEACAPWLCDIGGYGVDGRQKSLFMPSYTAALEYYDTINFAKRLRNCKVVINLVGLGDYTANPAGITALYNNLDPSVSKTLEFEQNRTHSAAPVERIKYSRSDEKGT